MIFSSDTKLLAVAGIVYALAGAAILCQAVFATFPLNENVEKRADRRLLGVQIEHHMDARLGAALLIAGFALQVIGTLGTPTLNGFAALLLIALAFGLVVYAMLKSTLAEDFLVAPAEDAVKVSVPAPADEIGNLVELRPAKMAETIS
jgi:hypothetical protein